MIQKSTLTFLSNLKLNNNKPWFDDNRKTYEAAKLDFTNFVSQAIQAIGVFEPSISNFLAKDCMFRINRDVRFSKDKSPYKTNMGAHFTPKGKKVNNAGYYIHIEPKQSFIAGGLWMPEANDLQKIRQEIDYNFDEFLSIINHKTFLKHFPNGLEKNEQLVRPPKGYDENNHAIAFLKLKSFVVSTPLSTQTIESKLLLNEITQQFKVIKPLVDFLNRAIG